MSLSQEKVESISKRCQDILSMQEVSIKDLVPFENIMINSISNSSCTTVHEVLQRQQIHNFCLKRDYNSKATLDPVCKEEIKWCISNLSLPNGRSVISHQVKLLIQSDVLKTGLGAFCQKTSTG